jgi:hypothetical protein
MDEIIDKVVDGVGDKVESMIPGDMEHGAVEKAKDFVAGMFGGSDDSAAPVADEVAEVTADDSAEEVSAA